jgi:hypothetical protein
MSAGKIVGRLRRHRIEEVAHRVAVVVLANDFGVVGAHRQVLFLEGKEVRSRAEQLENIEAGHDRRHLAVLEQREGHLGARNERIHDAASLDDAEQVLVGAVAGVRAHLQPEFVAVARKLRRGERTADGSLLFDKRGFHAGLRTVECHAESADAAADDDYLFLRHVKAGESSIEKMICNVAK